MTTTITSLPLEMDPCALESVCGPTAEPDTAPLTEPETKPATTPERRRVEPETPTQPFTPPPEGEPGRRPSCPPGKHYPTCGFAGE